MLTGNDKDPIPLQIFQQVFDVVASTFPYLLLPIFLIVFMLYDMYWHLVGRGSIQEIKKQMAQERDEHRAKFGLSPDTY